VAAPQKIKRPRKFVWQRDVRMVIRPGICRYSDTDAAQDNNIYVLPHIGPTCAIVPRGMFAYDPETFARYACYLKGFIEARYAENMTIYLVILRGAYDILTAETILHMRKAHRQIKLICAEVSDTYFMKFKPPLRERYRNILRQADETHQYEQNLDIGEAEKQALMQADSLLYIISENTIHIWKKIINTIWVDLQNNSDQLYNITQCWIVYMKWIMHQEIDALIL